MLDRGKSRMDLDGKRREAKPGEISYQSTYLLPSHSYSPVSCSKRAPGTGLLRYQAARARYVRAGIGTRYRGAQALRTLALAPLTWLASRRRDPGQRIG